MVASGTSSATTSTLLLSKSEEDYIREGCLDNCRIDGRTRTDFRTYSIIVNSEKRPANHDDDEGNPRPVLASLPFSSSSPSSPSPSSSPPLILSNGSARLVSSDQRTHLLCSVKADIVHPAIHAPHEGVVELYVDRLTAASTATRKSDDELQALCRSLLLDELLDKNALCILPHHYVWRITIDLYLLSVVAGSLLDAASHVIRAALQHTVLPLVTPSLTSSSDAGGGGDTSSSSLLPPSQANATTDLLVDSDVCAAQPLPGADRAPILATVTVLKCRDPHASSSLSTPHSTFVILHDATAEEEACSYCQVHVAVDLGGSPSSSFSTNENNPSVPSPLLCGWQTLGRGSLPLSLLPDITASAVAAAQSAQQAYRVVQGTSSTSFWLQDTFAMQ